MTLNVHGFSSITPSCVPLAVAALIAYCIPQVVVPDVPGPKSDPLLAIVPLIGDTVYTGPVPYIEAQ